MLILQIKNLIASGTLYDITTRLVLKGARPSEAIRVREAEALSEGARLKHARQAGTQYSQNACKLVN